MKKVLICLFVIMTSFLYNERGFSALPIVEIEQCGFYEHFWTVSESGLKFNINLSEGLSFEDSYYTSFLEEGLWCQVTCRPNESIFFMSEGHELLEVIFEVAVANTEDPDKLFYEILIQSSFQSINEQGLTSIKSKVQSTIGLINVSNLDLFTSPEFFTYFDEPNLGTIVFDIF